VRAEAVRWTIVGGAAIACVSTSAPTSAQEVTPAPTQDASATTAATEATQDEPAADAPLNPTSSALAGAENLTAAERALQLTQAARELERRARTEAGDRKQNTEATANELKEAARRAKLEAFHPTEFAKTRDAARTIADEAELRRLAAEKVVSEATARRDAAEATVTKLKTAPGGDAEPEDVAEAAAELARRKSELEAAEESREQTRQASRSASLAAGSAEEAVEAASVALALTSAHTAAMKRATTEPEATPNEAMLAARELEKAVDERKVEAFDKWLEARTHLDEYRRQLPGVAAAEKSAQLARPVSDSETLSNGARLSWGITGSLLRFQTQRSENLPGRSRNFRPRYEFVPGEAGFQFLVEPASSPWRLQLKNGETLQLMSWGGLLLASLGEDKALERGSLSLGATLVFFRNAIGLGGGFDLYRGIPVRGADGAPGGDTAFTGVLAWALAQEGEVTAENAFVVVTVNLSSVIGALTGKEDGDADN
jgi:hypothetical protein